MKQLTQAGQIKQGAKVQICNKGIWEAYHVDEVLNAGTDHEEIILDREINLYFITSMAIDGTSWVEKVQFFNIDTLQPVRAD